MILLYVVVGGVGLIVLQWVKLFGLIVIGMVLSEVKVDIVCVYGCDYVINYVYEDVVKCVCEFIDGVGVNVVFDSVGKVIFDVLFDLFK